MARAAVFVAALLAAPASAYVSTPGQGQRLNRVVSVASPAAAVQETVFEEHETVEQTSGMSAVMASLGVGAVLGWLSKRQNQAAAAAAAATVAAAPLAASALVDYEGIEFLGGSDRVDINNAPVQAYRQFPGFYPTAAGKIASGGPYKNVEDVYNLPGLTDASKAVIKKYEKNLVCLPVSPAYFLDRINNGMYK
eukprot:TRINITY_DN413_c0_g1_i4.p1 TRINITY_DN413_c0_g1~~TRINITY_DN413_c0_g1_i4.p1  ORF type:complete len:194 (+),score=66.18 TRINITY_DN413_c0_g1_i4:70-651(+)